MDTKDLRGDTRYGCPTWPRRRTKAAIDELILLWRGSKLVVSGFKILIPVFAALLGAKRSGSRTISSGDAVTGTFLPGCT